MKRLALVLVPSLLCLACGDEPPPSEAPPRAVRLQQVGADEGAGHTTYSGVSRSSEQTRLSFRVSGPVLRLNATVGQEVEEGAVLAELDSSDLNLQAAEAGSSVAQARAQARQAQAEYERVRSLYEAQGASRSELDAARAQAQTAQTALRASSSRAAVSRNQAQYARLTAPSAGRISLVSIEPGENVSAGQTVIVLESGAAQEVTVAVPETVIARIERGSSVEVTFAALEGQTLTGSVFEVGVSAESSTYPVTVRLAEEPEALRPGMAAQVRFSLAQDDNTDALMVPATAVAADSEGSFVYTVESAEPGYGTVHRRAVEVGELTDRGIVVEDGLEAGESVVTAGVSRISDGLRVRVPEAVDADDAEEG
ncbi:MAG: efflux RND transporter periplasmic adaptor subunit [Sandaracinaceae bacterium]